MSRAMDQANEMLAEALLVYARALLQTAVAGAPAPAADLPGARLGGLFITIYDEAGEVRGSMGTTAPGSTPAELVAELLTAAALDDPRFPPLTAAEIDRCKLAVTVLEEPVRIDSPAAIEPGKTALRITAGLFSGTTLPEVAWGRGWEASTYLAFACRKAGLHALAWKKAETEVLAYRSWRAAEPW